MARSSTTAAVSSTFSALNSHSQKEGDPRHLPRDALQTPRHSPPPGNCRRARSRSDARLSIGPSTPQATASTFGRHDCSDKTSVPGPTPSSSQALLAFHLPSKEVTIDVSGFCTFENYSWSYREGFISCQHLHPVDLGVSLAPGQAKSRQRRSRKSGGTPIGASDGQLHTPTGSPCSDKSCVQASTEHSEQH